jgi:iron(III) transport system permease protein
MDVERSARIAGALVAVVMVLLLVPPLLFLLQASLFRIDIMGNVGTFTLQYYQALFSNRDQLTPLLNSVLFATASAGTTVLLAGVLAWIVERTDTPLKGVVYFAAVFSFAVPFIVYVIAWILILGDRGLLNASLDAIFGPSGPHFNLYSLPGMAFVETLLWSPLAFLMLSAVFRSMDANLEEAAYACGASVVQTFRRISFRLALPAVLAVALIVFIRALAAFEVPALVGLPAGLEVITTKIYLDVVNRTTPDYGHASALSLVLMLISLTGLLLYTRCVGAAQKYQTITGKGYRPRILQLGRTRWICTALVLVYIFGVLVVPIGTIIWATLLPYYQPPSIGALRLLTLENYSRTFTYPQLVEGMRNSLMLGVTAATVVMLISAVGCATPSPA